MGEGKGWGEGACMEESEKIRRKRGSFLGGRKEGACMEEGEEECR
jgi:hypothetical protein